MALTEKGIELLKGGSDQPGTDEFADVADINAAFRKIDGLVGVTLCTSLTKPSEPFKGQMILELDTSILSVFNRTTNAWVVLSNPTSNVPVGSILTHAGATPPTSFLFAQGDSLLKSSYPALFSVIGTQYGSADATRFNLPNLKGRVVVGVDTGQSEFSTLGEVGGRKTTSHASYDAPVNSNNFQAGGQNYANAVVSQMNTYLTANGSSSIFRGISVQAVGGQILAQGAGNTEVRHLQYTATNLQPYAAMRYIIKF